MKEKTIYPEGGKSSIQRLSGSKLLNAVIYNSWCKLHCEYRFWKKMVLSWIKPYITYEQADGEHTHKKCFVEKYYNCLLAVMHTKPQKWHKP